MANLPEIIQWEAGVYQLETTDPVLGGPDGIDNLQAKQLANRTAFLKKQIDDVLSGLTVPVGLATMNYIQAQLDKLDHKQSVRVATTANISLSGVQTIDSVAVNSGDRVLVKNQTDATTNGIYTANGSTWSRAADANESGEVTSGLVVYVEEGTLQGKSRWQLTTPLPITIGSSALTFGDITAGMAPLASPAFTNSPTAPTLARFATGGGLVNADTLRANGVQAGGFRGIALSAANVTLTANDAGTLVAVTGSGGGTLTLPAANSVPVGASILIVGMNTTLSTNQLKTSGADILSGYNGEGAASTSTAVMRGGDAAMLVSNGVDTWVAASTNTNQQRVVAQAQSVFSPVVGSIRNGRMSVLEASASATYTADEIVVETALGGLGYRIANFNKPVNLASTGVNGMDTGAAPVNGWVALYAIYNPATGAQGLLAQDVGNSFATSVYSGPAMPSGFTASALLTVVGTNFSRQFRPCLVRGDRVGIVIGTAYSGSASVSNNPISISSLVPANATEIAGELSVANSGTSSMSLTVFNDTSQISQQNITANLNGNALTMNYASVILSINQQMMFTSQSTAGTAFYNIYITAYKL